MAAQDVAFTFAAQNLKKGQLRMFVIKMKNYKLISLLGAVFFLGSINLCLGQTLDKSDSVIFESEVYHLSFYYP